MKPLELTVYPLDPSFPRGYKLPRDTRITFVAANRMAKAKRLTTTELAAEYWRTCLDAQEAITQREVADRDKRKKHAKHHSKQVGIEFRRMFVLERFATLPHYDEEAIR